MILDKCDIHHVYAEWLRAMVEAVGSKLMFLVPYSPINNPTEMTFSSFKLCWRRNGHWLNDAPPYVKIHYCFDNYGSNGEAAGTTYYKCGYSTA